MKRLAISIFSAAILTGLAFAGPVMAQRVLEGRVTVVRDVDTVVVAGTPVRLNGVDGPETSTMPGRDARRFMVNLVRAKIVSCQLNGDRTYDRWVGTCFIDGEDVGQSPSRMDTPSIARDFPVGGIVILKRRRQGRDCREPDTVSSELVG